MGIIVIMKPIIRLVLALVLLPAGLARTQDQPLLDELTRTFKKEYLSLGVLFQAVGDFQAERNLPGSNGFNISNMRLILSGELDGDFGYVFKTNFSKSPSILDAKVYYKVSPTSIVDIGLFKPPFSIEIPYPQRDIHIRTGSMNARAPE